MFWLLMWLAKLARSLKLERPRQCYVLDGGEMWNRRGIQNVRVI